MSGEEENRERRKTGKMIETASQTRSTTMRGADKRGDTSEDGFGVHKDIKDGRMKVLVMTRHNKIDMLIRKGMNIHMKQTKEKY